MKNNEPVKVFESGIRTHIHFYKDGTIERSGISSPGRGIYVRTFYRLGADGIERWKEGYEENMAEESYKSLLEPGTYSATNPGIDPDESMIEEYVETINGKYREDKIIEHSFTPFVLDEEGTDEAVGKNEKEVELSDDEIKNIMKENYSELEELLLEDSISDLYEKHHEIEEAQSIWKTGVDPNSPFYEDMYELLYPKVNELVAEAGMESLINEKYSLYWQPPATISFFGPSPDLEVLDKDKESFKIKQTKVIGPQEVGGESYDLIYIVEYVKEDDKWKFAGAEMQK